MKANGIIFRVKAYEEKGEHSVWLLCFNEESGMLDKKATKITNKRTIYSNLKYNQIQLVRWRMFKKVKNKPSFTLSDINRIDVHKIEEDGRKEIPINILIKSNEFLPLWIELWNTKVKPYNISQGNGRMKGKK